MQCPHCRAPLVPGAAFCVECGFPITPTPPAPAAPEPVSESAAGMPMMPPDPASFPVAPPAAPPVMPSQSQPALPAEYSAVPPSAPSAPFPYDAASPPAQPVYEAQPPTPAFSVGTQPPGAEPSYGTPPSVPPQPQPQPQPTYILPASQPLYSNPPQLPLYTAPVTTPVSAHLSGFQGGTSVSQSLLGPNGVPGAAQPYSRMQAMLMRNLSSKTVASPWLMGAIGAVAALVVGLILTALSGALWSNALDDLLGNSLVSGSNAATSSLGAFGDIARQVLTPDLLKLFALAHHVSLNITGAASAQLGASGQASTSAGGSLALTLPLTGLLLAPALALTLGGYVSAGSDFTRQARFSIARGAVIAPFYAVLLAVCAMLGSTTTSASSSSGSLLAGSGTLTVAPSVIEAVLYGLLWGAVFGALGGWIHVSGRYWLSTALATLQTVRRGLLAGALAGAGAALVTGILLFSVAYIGLATYGGVSGVASSTATAASSTSVVTTLTLYLLFAPVAAVYAFALATGAPLGLGSSESISHTTSSVTISLLNGYQTSTPTTPGAAAPLTGAPPHFPPSPIFYILPLGALLAYLVGGRIAARVARAQGAGGGFVAGALIAVPLSVMLTFAAYLATAGLTFSLNVGGQSDLIGISASPVYGGMFLAVLVAGAVCGGIGGASVSALPWLSGVPRALLMPFRPFARMLAPLVDRLVGRDRRQQPGLAMRWIYDGVGVALVLAVLAVALDIFNSAAPTLVPFAVLWQVEGVVVALLVALPLACFLGALIAAFAAPAPIQPPPVPALVVQPAMPVYASVPAGFPMSLPPSMPGGYAPSMPQAPASYPLAPYPVYPPAPAQPPSYPQMPDYGAASPGTGLPPQPPS